MGYMKQCEAYVDTDADRAYDSGEPSTATNNAGFFSLIYQQPVLLSCARWLRLGVHGLHHGRCSIGALDHHRRCNHDQPSNDHSSFLGERPQPEPGRSKRHPLAIVSPRTPIGVEFQRSLRRSHIVVSIPAHHAFWLIRQLQVMETVVSEQVFRVLTLRLLAWELCCLLVPFQQGCGPH